MVIIALINAAVIAQEMKPFVTPQQGSVHLGVNMIGFTQTVNTDVLLIIPTAVNVLRLKMRSITLKVQVVLHVQMDIIKMF